MAIALAAFGLSFAALCVWLTVRIVNRRERWAKWTLAILVLFTIAIAYPLSYGPWLWYCLNHFRSAPDIAGGGFYAPLLRFTTDGPRWLTAPYNAYLRWCMNFGILW